MCSGLAVENNKVRARTPLVQTTSSNSSILIQILRHVLGTANVRNYATHHDIDPQGYFRLTGPIRPVTSHTEIFSRLFRKAASSSLDSGKLVPDCLQISSLAEDYRLWKILLTERELYIDVATELGLEMSVFNRVLCEEFETLFGPARVTFSVYHDSVEAFVRVKILKLRGELGQSGNIYGAICASSVVLNDYGAKSFVMDRKRDDALTSKAQQFVPLQRNRIVVPMDHELKLDLEIMNRDDDDLGIINCGVKFMPRCWFKGDNDYIRDSVEIEMEFCEVKVEVFWSPWWVIWS